MILAGGGSCHFSTLRSMSVLKVLPIAPVGSCVGGLGVGGELATGEGRFGSLGGNEGVAHVAMIWRERCLVC